MPFTIRSAVPEDAPVLFDLNTAFNGDTGITAEDICRSLLRCNEVVVIAESAGSPAGFCCAQVHRSFCYPAPVAEVTEMYVSEPFRRQGCATQMIRFLETLLLQQGVGEIHLLTGVHNQAAQAAYQYSGFMAVSEQYMRKCLAGEEKA